MAVVVAVGSTNPVKVEAVRLAFMRAFPTAEPPRIVGVSAASGVRDQPMGDEETRTGAFNRAVNAAAAMEGTPPTFAVGLEGGCGDETFIAPGGARQSALITFAYMAVLHVGSGEWGWARTGTFMLPPAVTALVRGGMELGHADDLVFGRTNSKQQDGAVGLLTAGAITRTTYYEHALILALTPFISSEVFSQRGVMAEEAVVPR